jgi:glycine cleavage system aminomethyltransferase T
MTLNPGSRFPGFGVQSFNLQSFNLQFFLVLISLPHVRPRRGRDAEANPLYALHRELGAKLIDFGGWEMPVQYQGILEEHRAVRERAGIFDVSHMGELEVTGSGFEMTDRGIARHGYPAQTPAGLGVVTSGTHSPTLGRPIGLALLPVAATAVGTEFFVDIRGRQTRARVVATPFYKRKKEVPA